MGTLWAQVFVWWSGLCPGAWPGTRPSCHSSCWSFQINFVMNLSIHTNTLYLNMSSGFLWFFVKYIFVFLLPIFDSLNFVSCKQYVTSFSHIFVYEIWGVFAIMLEFSSFAFVCINDHFASPVLLCVFYCHDFPIHFVVFSLLTCDWVFENIISGSSP